MSKTITNNSISYIDLSAQINCDGNEILSILQIENIKFVNLDYYQAIEKQIQIPLTIAIFYNQQTGYTVDLQGKTTINHYLQNNNIFLNENIVFRKHIESTNISELYYLGVIGLFNSTKQLHNYKFYSNELLHENFLFEYNDLFSFDCIV